MTRVLLDPHEMRRSSTALSDGAQTVATARVRLRPDDVGSLPPSVAAYVRHELSAAAAGLAQAAPRVQAHTRELAARARLAELADGDLRASARFVERTGLLRFVDRFLETATAAASLFLNPSYATRAGVIRRWHKTAGQPLVRRVSAFRGYARAAGHGLRGAAAREHAFLRRNSVVANVSKVLTSKSSQVITKRLPFVGDGLTANGTYGHALAEGASRPEAAARATGATLGSRGGSMAGALGGAMVGATLGSAVPIVGTGVGGVVGGIVGGLAGSEVGRHLGEDAGKAVYGAANKVKGFFKW